MAYNNRILEHFNNPKNVGEFEENASNIGTSLVGAPSCGDVLKFSIKIEKNTITDAKFLAFGCGAAIASSSLLTEKVIGKTLEEAVIISNKELAKELALPPVKYHCSVLAEEAIKGAISNYQSKQDEKK